MVAATLTFDRLAYIDRLTSGGIDEGHARAHAAALDSALQDSVATRSDLEELRFDLRKEMADLGRELRGEMQDLGRELRGEMQDLGRELRGEMQDIRSDLRQTEIRLEAKIDTVAAALKVDVLRWLIVTQVALGGFTFAVAKFVH